MSSGTTPGGKVLATKSALAKARANGPAFRDILVIEDEKLAADRLDGTVHAVLGYDVTIRRAKTLAQALDLAIARQPDLILLDDHLKPKDTANDTIPYLRKVGCAGPIIVQSSLLTRRRAAEVLALGASAAIHKDDLDGTSLATAIDKVLKDFEAGKLPVVVDQSSPVVMARARA